MNKKYGTQKLNPNEYMHYIASYLIENSMAGCTCIPQRTSQPGPMKTRLIERHFIDKIPHNPMQKSWPNPICQGCNFSKNEMAKMGFEPRTLPRRTTTYECKQYNIPLCITPCFEIYHNVDNYRRTLLLR